VFYSELIEEELSIDFSTKQIKDIFSILAKEQLLIKIEITWTNRQEALRISKQFNVPRIDSLHAVLAKNNDAILVTRDRHFQALNTPFIIKKPEELI